MRAMPNPRRMPEVILDITCSIRRDPHDIVEGGHRRMEHVISRITSGILRELGIAKREKLRIERQQGGREGVRVAEIQFDRLRDGLQIRPFGILSGLVNLVQDIGSDEGNQNPHDGQDADDFDEGETAGGGGCRSWLVTRRSLLVAGRW